MASDLATALLPYAGVAFERQLQLEDVLPSGPGVWADASAGTVHIGENGTPYQMQVLGSLGRSAPGAPLTFLWAWANINLQLPEERLTHVHRLRAYGEEHGIEPLTCGEAQVTDDGDMDMHMLCMLAVGVCDAGGYIKTPNGPGQVAMLLEKSALPVDERPPHQRLLFVFPQLIAAIPLPDHRAALEAYARYHGMSVTRAGSESVLADDQGRTVTASFDAQSRMTNIKGTV